MNSGSCSQMSSSCNCPSVSEIVTRDTRQHSQKALRALTRSSFLVSRTSLSVSLLLGGRTSEHENKHLPPLPDARCTPTRSASAKSEPEMAANLVTKRSVAMMWKIRDFVQKVYYRRTDFNCYKMFEKFAYKYPLYFILFHVV